MENTTQLITAAVLVLTFAAMLIVIIVQARNAHLTTAATLAALTAQFTAKSNDKAWKDTVEGALAEYVTPETRATLNKLVDFVQALTPDDVDAFLESARILFNQITDGLPNTPSEDRLRTIVTAIVKAENARNVGVGLQEREDPAFDRA